MNEEIEILKLKYNELEKELTNKKRELEIEAALEKVRSCSLAMQHSNELQEIIDSIPDRFKALDVNLDMANILIFKEGVRDFEYWMANDKYLNATRFRIPYADLIILEDILNTWGSGQELLSKSYSAEEKKELFDYFFNQTDFKYAPESWKNHILESTYYALAIAIVKNIGVLITSYSKPSFTVKEQEVLKRFANVFYQAYTRFLDLQKAEPQAREAQIQAALEVVRSRSLAMHNSEELSEVVTVLFERVAQLGVVFDGININIIKPEVRGFDSWLAAPGQAHAMCFHIPYFDDPVTTDLFNALDSGTALFTKIYSREEKDPYFHHVFTLTDFKQLPDERKQMILGAEQWCLCVAIAKKTAISLHSYTGHIFTENEHEIIKRFSNVFEQAYVRFLDLEKAEAHAKEAQKQSSLDRVRAEIASMRKAKDLERITPLIWNELSTLAIPFIRCGVFIMNEKQQLVHVYLSTPDGKAIAAFTIPFASEYRFMKVLIDSWRANKILLDHWEAATFKEWTHSLVTAGLIQTDEKYSTEAPPENLYLHLVPFLQGMLYVGNTSQLSEEALNLLRSLADAFSTAYARYEDFNRLEMAKQKIESTLAKLKSTQSLLVQKEKMASLGELTAGIAHEIQNPLNFVNNFSEINTELIEELKDELAKKDGERDELLEVELLEDIDQNLQKILHHGKRADGIVKGMLQHSRVSSGKKEWINLNGFVEQYLRLSYHGLRAKEPQDSVNKTFNPKFTTHFDDSINKVNVIPQDLSRVLLNLFNNAFYSVYEKKKAAALNGKDYEPLVSVTTEKQNGSVIVKVTDNGNGIPPNIIDKIFQPFFTTKPTGQGTGLGLSLSYDIIKAHGGEIQVESNVGVGATFKVYLPLP